MCYGQIIGSGFNWMGAGISAYGQMQQAKAEKKAYNRMAAIEAEKLKISQQQAADLALEKGEERRQKRGQALAAAAANGVSLDASILDAPQMWEQDQAALGQYETDKIARDAELEAWGFMTNSDMLKWQGKMSKYGAKFKVASMLMSTAAQEASKASSYGSSMSSQ